MSDDNPKEYIDPKIASKIVENGAPYIIPDAEDSENDLKAKKESDLLRNTSDAIRLRKQEISGQIKLEKARIAGKLKSLEVNQSAKERAGKHLAIYGAFYLCTMVLSFLWLVYSMRDAVTEAGAGLIATVATLITLVISNLSSILRGITEVEVKKDPTELLHDIIIRNMDAENENK